MSPSSNSDNQVTTRIEFPCLYPIKIIGRLRDGFQAEVVATIERHTGKIREGLVSLRASRKKNYVSITVTITATGEDQLSHIFLDLQKIENVKMVI